MLEYLDFDLEIGEGEGRDHSLAVLHSPAGEAQAVFHFPFDELALERYQDKLKIALLRSGGRHRQVLSSEEQAAQDFGKALFQAVFSGDVRSCFDRSLERAQAQGKGLRIRLRIRPPDLAALPWEYLYDSRQAEYLCLSQNTPIVRYMETLQPPLPLTVAPPLRVLGMIASPVDLPALDVETEKERLERAIKPLQQRGLASRPGIVGRDEPACRAGVRHGPRGACRGWAVLTAWARSRSGPAIGALSLRILDRSPVERAGAQERRKQLSVSGLPGWLRRTYLS